MSVPCRGADTIGPAQDTASDRGERPVAVLPVRISGALRLHLGGSQMWFTRSVLDRHL